ncbi:hypothetical protein Ddye_010008 [Dipteronia dyeriana]|uniref:Uncharacterized protein n=1 Tax=Dipteronia dyeriana TaxID=168575 RepID=A0AAD9XCE1_9ROSI|nr:hypothetical protein Ddye_010008 [Dipteronia dyeriana]
MDMKKSSKLLQTGTLKLVLKRFTKFVKNKKMIIFLVVMYQKDTLLSMSERIEADTLFPYHV